MTSEATLGLVLAGGLARRMGGGDKALLRIGEATILERVLDRLTPQCSGVILNANGDPGRFAFTHLPVVADDVPGFAGPLAGILAGLDWAATHAPSVAWIASVPGDCPFLPRDMVARLHAEGAPPAAYVPKFFTAHEWRTVRVLADSPRGLRHGAQVLLHTGTAEVTARAIVLAGAIRFCAPRFGELALAAGGVSHGPARSNRRAANFRPKSPGQALRRKEWLLLLRDPWLMSQSLMQLLYLLPPFFLLSRMFYGEGNGAALLVPVLIMAAGQLAGGLAWLAISGEDAPDLIATAPVTASSDAGRFEPLAAYAAHSVNVGRIRFPPALTRCPATSPKKRS